LDEPSLSWTKKPILSLGVRQRLIICLVLSTGLFLIAGCVEEASPSRPGISSESVPADRKVSPTATAALHLEASPNNDSPIEEADPHPQVQLKGEGNELEAQSETGRPRCGILLPLNLPAVEPPVTAIPEREIPAGLIPESALPAVQLILSEPESVGLVAYRVGWEDEGLYLNENTPMPLASVIKVINLIAYAEAVSAGELNPAEWVPLSDLAKTYLPGMDLGSHNRALADLEERNLIGRQPLSTPLEEVPWMMTRFSSNAAADYLHLALGQETLEETARNLGLDNHTAPCPWIGQFLIMSNHTDPSTTSRTVTDYLDHLDSYGQKVMELAIAYSEDDAFREAELEWRRRQPSIQIQRNFAEKLNGQGTALEYANLMDRIIENNLASSFVNILVRRNLEWPMIFSENQERFSYLGMKNGSLPGILTTVYYGQRLEDGAKLVVALFFRNLPMSTYRRWRRDLPHDELARWLLFDPDAISIMNDLLS